MQPEQIKPSDERITITCPHCLAQFRRTKAHERDRPIYFCAYCGHALREKPPFGGGAFAPTQLPEHAPDRSKIQKKIDHYEVVSSIGKGGMGEVFLAFDTICGRRVALKQIRSDLSSHPQLQKRFLREAEITSQLTHPTIVPIYSIHKGTDLAYYTMPYLEGETLRQLLRRAKLATQRNTRPKDPHTSIPALMRIFHQVCQAVAYAHSKGVLHRDLKPENFIVGTYGQVLILDWGLVTLMNDENDEPLPDLEAEDETRITRIGKVVGTIAYMAPERAFGSKATVQSDIYSLGVVLYQILTLSLPFHRKSLKEFKKLWKSEQLLPPEIVAPYREVPQILSEIVKRCLASDPKQRYSSVDELIESLESYLEGRSEWFLVRELNIRNKNDWQFQENMLVPEYTAITRTQERSDWVSVMVAKDPFPENTKIEAKVKVGDQGHGLGFLFAIPSPINHHHLTEGYCLWISTEDQKTKTKLTHSSVSVLVAPDIILKKDEWVRIRIERIDQHIYFYMNDMLQFSYVSHIPIIGTHIGLIAKDADFEIEDFSVSVGSQNIQISCLAIPDAFLANRDFDRALTEYRKIATLFPGRAEGREALFRAGITLLEKAKDSENRSQMEALFNQAHEEFHKLKKTPGAPLEYLGKALIYQASGEYDEEVKCFALAIRKYPNHPHLLVLEEQIALRLHECSRHNRYVAYEFVLLVMKHLPHLLETSSTRRLIKSLEKHWERPWFIEHVPSEDTDLHRLGFCLIAAFWLAKPYSIHETLRELLQRPILPVAEIKDAIYLMIELGAYDLATDEMRFILELLSQQEYKKFEGSFLLFQLMIHKACSDETVTYPVFTNDFASARCYAFLLKNAFRKSNISDYQKLTKTHSALFTLPPSPCSYREALDAICLGCALWFDDTVTAKSIIERYSEETLSSEKSPLYFMYGCWLAKNEGVEIAQHLFSDLLTTPYPDSALLAAHALAGHIDILRSSWQKQAFFFEKRTLFENMALFYRVSGDSARADGFFTLVQKCKIDSE